MTWQTQRRQSVRRSVGTALVLSAEKEHPVLTSMHLLIVYLPHRKTFQMTVVQSNSHPFFVLCDMPICVQILLLLLLSSSSSSPLCTVFILIFLRQALSLGNVVLQLFCCYYALLLLLLLLLLVVCGKSY